MTIAETPQLFDGRALLSLLGILVLEAIFLLCVATACVWAYRAGRGARLALLGWIAVGVVVIGFQVLATVGVIQKGFDAAGLLPGGMLAFQAALFALSRWRAGSASAPGESLPGRAP